MVTRYESSKCFLFQGKMQKKTAIQIIPNGCLDAYEVKVNIDILKYQEKVKLISQFQRFFHFSMAY